MNIYVTLPQEFHSPQGNQVCHLKKSLYGLKQASRQWYSKLSYTLLSLGYQQSISDYSLFVKHHRDHTTVLLVYVDDLILVGTSMTEINSVKVFFNEQFRIKDLGDLKFFLDLEVAHSKTGISLSQRKYSFDILTDAGTPLETSRQYKQLTGRLLYLSSSRL